MKNHKTLSICVIGRPNAGKSSLLNRIIGQKISIVTPKVQTTRSVITGIVTIGDTQLILFDTPGIFAAKRKPEKAMVRYAWSSLNGADMVMLVIDNGKTLDEFSIKILERIKESKIQPVFVLNKIDLIRHPKQVLASQENTKRVQHDLQDDIKKHFPHAPIFKISALHGDGVDNLIDYIIAQAPKTPWLYEADDITTLPMRFLAAEITREQLFLNLHDELPYNLVVESEKWEQKKDGSVKIHQVIIIARDSHKAILLGNKGSMISKIGTKSRLEMEKSFGFSVHLFLFVKVRPAEVVLNSF